MDSDQRAVAIVLVALAVACSCRSSEGDGGPPPPRDAEDELVDDVDDDEGVAADVEEEARDGDGPRSGPLTFAVGEVRILDDRRCDLDGDGLPDNAVADLGLPSSRLFAATVSTLIQGRVEPGAKRIIHFPWVGDLWGLTDSEVVLLLFRGEDEEDPDVRENDLSGEEPFFADPVDLDACGEPLFFVPDVQIDGGELAGSSGTLSVIGGLIMRQAQISGTIEPRGRRAEVIMCGYAVINDLGDTESFDWGGLTFLEMLLAGGAAIGVASLPGLTPDVDLDGDGLERFLLNDDGQISACIDGDLSSLPGRDCWQDEAMADGFSINLLLDAVSARYVGREPGWAEDVEGTCADGPPEQSLFDSI